MLYFLNEMCKHLFCVDKLISYMKKVLTIKICIMKLPTSKFYSANCKLFKKQVKLKWGKLSFEKLYKVN